MRSEVHLRGDVLGVLQAVLTAERDLIRHAASPSAMLYTAGFVAAIRAIAAGFGIDPELELGLNEYELWHEMAGDQSRVLRGNAEVIPINTALMNRGR